MTGSKDRQATPKWQAQAGIDKHRRCNNFEMNYSYSHYTVYIAVTQIVRVNFLTFPIPFVYCIYGTCMCIFCSSTVSLQLLVYKLCAYSHALEDGFGEYAVMGGMHSHCGTVHIHMLWRMGLENMPPWEVCIHTVGPCTFTCSGEWGSAMRLSTSSNDFKCSSSSPPVTKISSM